MSSCIKKKEIILLMSIFLIITGIVLVEGRVIREAHQPNPSIKRQNIVNGINNDIENNARQLPGKREAYVAQQVQQDPLQRHREYVDGLIATILNNTFMDTSSYTEIAGQTVSGDISAFAGNYASGGDGTLGNPYIFENLFINASATEMYFNSIPDYFVIRNSLVFGKLRLENSFVQLVENLTIFSQSTALSLLGLQNMVVSGNTIVGNGSTYVMSIGGSRNLDIRNNTVITGEFAGGLIISTGTYSVTNVNLTRNLFQTQYSVIFGVSGLAGNNRFIGNIFNASSSSTLLSVIPRGDLEFSDNVMKVHYTPYKWEGAIFFSGLDKGSNDRWVIRNNSISGLEDGFSFYSPSILQLEGNTIRDSLHGVKFYNVYNQSQVASNLIEDTQVGFYVRVSANNTISNTTMRHVEFGSIFEFATSNVLNSTYIEDFNWLVHDITENIPPNLAINSIEIGKKGNGVEIKTDNDFDTWASSEDIPGTGTMDDPFVISDLVVDGGLGIGIETNYTVKLKDLIIKNVFADIVKPLKISSGSGIILENVTVVNATNGVFLDTSGAIVIINSSFSGFRYFSTIHSEKPSFITGIRYADSDEGLSLTLKNSTISNFEFMNVYGSQQMFVSGANLTFMDGSVTGGTDAFKVAGSSNVTIKRTTINGTTNPILVSEVFGFVFKDNYVTMNEHPGELQYVDNVNITGNFFVDNKDSAFFTDFSYLDKPFSVWNNYFINNGWITGAPQIRAYDTIVPTVDGIGNYWSDLPDNATTYDIQGNLDTAPIRPWVEPLDISVEYSTFVSFEVTSDFPVSLQSWTLYQNNTKLSSGTWSGNSMTYSFHPTDLGSYTFEIEVRDIYGVKGVNATMQVLVMDSIKPSIAPVPDIHFTEGDTEQQIVWMISDLFPATYEIFKNETIIDSGTWNSPMNLTIDLSTLTAGTYNYTLRVYDTSGNSATDEVIVRVDAISATSTTPTSSSTSVPSTISSSTDMQTSPTSTDNNGSEGTTSGGETSSLNWFWFFLILVINAIPLYYAGKSYFEGKRY